MCAAGRENSCIPVLLVRDNNIILPMWKFIILAPVAAKYCPGKGIICLAPEKYIILPLQKNM
jgi:hypothetical protein